MIKEIIYCDLCGKEMTEQDIKSGDLLIAKVYPNLNRRLIDVCEDCSKSFSNWVESRMPQADCSWMKAEK